MPPSGVQELQEGRGVSREQEKERILQILETSDWVQKLAAQRLGVSPRVMNYKIKKYGITHPEWIKNRD